MKKTRTLLLTLAPILVAAGVMTLVAGDEVIAQVRAAWTKNVDEPGLVPFSYQFRISQNDCNCTNCCFVQTDPVPAGKRLVIKHVSGYAALAAPANLGPVTVSQMTPAFQLTLLATVPATFRTQWNGGDYPAYEFNEEVLAYVDAGNRARFAIYTGGSWGFQSGQAVINGYLVSLQ